MNRYSYFSIFALLFLILANSSRVQSQTPGDQLMMPAGDICVLASYDFGSFDQYWEGDRLRENQTIATVQRTTLLPMAAIGIFKNLNLFVGTPYIKTESTEPNGGKFTGAQGFQDISIALKYQAVKLQIAQSEFSALASVGFSTPISNYLSDYMPYSLGFGAPELNWRGILHFKMNNGIYARASGAYLWRGYTEAERDYYYNNGSYYTAWMDVPSVWSIDGALGVWLLDNSLRVEINYMALKSTSGDDIRPYNAPQPTNKVNFDRAGIFAQYYLPFIKGLGLVAYHNRILDGLNTGKMNNTGAGLTYQFTFLKPKK